jgi:hypothetical protein
MIGLSVAYELHCTPVHAHQMLESEADTNFNESLNMSIR